MNQLVTMEKAISLLTALPVRPGVERIPIDRADGRVAAEDIRAVRPMPPFRRSAFDGYVMRYEDTLEASKEHPVTLRVIETVTAGDRPGGELAEGTAIRIMTGALCPDNGTCVVKYEETEFEDGCVTIFRPMQKEKNVIPVGEEYDAGELLIEKGTRLDPALSGILATQGMTEVPVYRKPIVSILGVGSELQPVGTELEPGKIYGSSGFTLAGYAERDGLSVKSIGLEIDDPAVLQERITALLEDSDLVITTGGASNGDHDFARAVMEKLGFRMLFRKVDMKPGACMMVGVRGALYESGEGASRILISLSGSPGAAVTSYLRIVHPLIRKLAGRKDLDFRTVSLPLESGYAKPIPHTRVVKGNLAVREDGRAVFRETPKQLNGMLTGFSHMNVLADIPVSDGPTPDGTVVQCRLLEP